MWYIVVPRSRGKKGASTKREEGESKERNERNERKETKERKPRSLARSPHHTMPLHTYVLYK